MGITIELPGPIEEKLRSDLGDLSVAGKEAMLVELYRQGRLTRYELSCALGLSRFQVDGLLKRHNVTEDLLTAEKPEQQLSTLRDQ